MKDFSNFLDVAFTITFVIAYYQVLMVYLSINVFNRDGVIKILAYFDHLVTDRKCEISEIRQRIFRCLLTGLGSVGFLVNCYDLAVTNFTAPMLFLIPGIPQDSIFLRPVNIIFQVTLYFATMGMIIISDAVIMIMIMYIQAELLSITELLSHLDIEQIHLSKSFWHTYFHKLLAIMMYLCFTFFTFQSINSSIILAVLIAISEVWEVFILCYFGQIIRNASEAMSVALYMSKWYLMDVADQKNLLMLMLRFKYPFKVETFGFGVISIYTFVQVLITTNYFFNDYLGYNTTYLSDL
uniref:Putative membrane protein n=1 Tax=Lutzomyia longipalpis TaxID=7200 RepID=A0A7G3AF06_LUTLO